MYSLFSVYIYKLIFTADIISPTLDGRYFFHHAARRVLLQFFFIIPSTWHCGFNWSLTNVLISRKSKRVLYTSVDVCFFTYIEESDTEFFKRIEMNHSEMIKFLKRYHTMFTETEGRQQFGFKLAKRDHRTPEAKKVFSL